MKLSNSYFVQQILLEFITNVIRITKKDCTHSKYFIKLEDVQNCGVSVWGGNLLVSGYFKSCIINYLSSHSRLLVQDQLQTFKL